METCQSSITRGHAARGRLSSLTLLSVAAALLAFFAVTACKKESTTTPSPSASTATEMPTPVSTPAGMSTTPGGSMMNPTPPPGTTPGS